MNILLDTNIVLALIRSENYRGIMQFVNPKKSLLYISVVTEAEIKSLAIRNKWGLKRLDFLETLLDEVNIMDVTQWSVNVYPEIDTYSQRLNPKFNSYPFDTPRNMGKNDLWIASLAAMMGLELVTTDSDFDHLNGIFLDVRKIQHADLVPFL